MPSLNLDINYFDHIKTRRLIGLLGKGAAELPIRLWAYCGKVHPKNAILAGYSAQEIEVIVEWWGKPGSMIEAMTKVGFLESVDLGYKVHDWEDHEGHLISFHERAKKGAAVRWGLDATSNASSINKQCPNQPAVPTNQPTITPMRAQRVFVKPTALDVATYAKTIGFTLDGARFVDYYDANGWKVGRNAMKSWQAAVRTWKSNGYSTGSNGYSKPSIPAPAPYKFIKPDESELPMPGELKSLMSGLSKAVPK